MNEIRCCVCGEPIFKTEADAGKLLDNDAMLLCDRCNDRQIRIRRVETLKRIDKRTEEDILFFKSVIDAGDKPDKVVAIIRDLVSLTTDGVKDREEQEELDYLRCKVRENYDKYQRFVTTSDSIPGYRVIENKGVVSGAGAIIVVTAGVGVEGLAKKAGMANIHEQLNELKKEAFETMLVEMLRLGANAVIALRFSQGTTMRNYIDLIAYGSAVVIEKTHDS